KLFASWGLYSDWPRMCTIIPQPMDSFRASLTVTITAIQPRLRLSGTNRLGFQPSMAISDRSRFVVEVITRFPAFPADSAGISDSFPAFLLPQSCSSAFHPVLS
ncbi:MAG: hypothetical protein KZQ65_05655, partial [Candidatus Thiodiazotropha sp. (ex Gloverina cf. vestifex)]|nr:hypothetical protein [Candidatus Thiodiazotropha sp. (ex Gloverina cf. vestifex)]